MDWLTLLTAAAEAAPDSPSAGTVLQTALTAGAALGGSVLAVSRLGARVTHLEAAVDAIHRRLTAWGAPQFVGKTERKGRNARTTRPATKRGVTKRKGKRK